MGHRRFRVLVVVAAGVFALWPASPASAHALLMHTTPAAGDILQTPPAQVSMRFSEPVRPVGGQVQALGPDGSRVDTGPPETTGTNLVLRLRTGLPNGTYRVSYRIVSVDGHPVSGGFTFSVGVPTLVAAGTVQSSGGATVNPAVNGALLVTRYLGFVGLLLIVGPIVFFHALWPWRLGIRGPVRLALGGAAVLAVATLAELYLQAPYDSGRGLFSASTSELADTLSSRVGIGLLVRLGVLALAVPLLLRSQRPASRTVLAVLGVVALATWPLTGHTGSSSVPVLTVLTDMVHLGAVAIWLGGLVMLVAFLLRRAAPEELATAMPTWSAWALRSVAALGVAGLVQAAVEVRTPGALVHTRYGLLLLAKAGLFALILAAAVVSRNAVRRKAGVARGRLRGSVAVEIGFAAAVLAVTALLVQTVPASTAVAQAGPGYEATLGTAVVSLRVHVVPARIGANTVQVEAFEPNGQHIQVIQWLATARLNARGVPPVNVALRPVAGDLAAGTVNLPLAGSWRFHFAVRISGADPDSAAVNASIKVP
jgi:copper transport protein